jgi:uncharacterized DUF497 family protein
VKTPCLGGDIGKSLRVHEHPLSGVAGALAGAVSPRKYGGSPDAAGSATSRSALHCLSVVFIRDPPKCGGKMVRSRGLGAAICFGREQSHVLSSVASEVLPNLLSDDYALTRGDLDSLGEQRFVTLGMSATGSLLVVVYTHREPDIYRIISAWKAIKPQRKQYEEARR